MDIPPAKHDNQTYLLISKREIMLSVVKQVIECVYHDEKQGHSDASFQIWSGFLYIV